MNSRLYVDIHVLQTVPPSCINRDDTGSPKTAVYGGVTRARVSSQAWKKAVRRAFTDIFPKELLGVRTKTIVMLLEKELADQAYPGDVQKAADALLNTAGLKIKSREEGTGAMFFISHAQVKALAKVAMENQDLKDKQLKPLLIQALKTSPGVDIALFGRMVADDPDLNVDASCQVAHAISTHGVTNEYDYFTAVDDAAEQDHAGAAHIGTVEFASATLYRYATIAVHELARDLGEDTVDAVTGFTRAFALSMPTGKQNTFANRTLPDSLMVTIRHDQPVNLVGAFEKAVPSGAEGHVALSEKCLVTHAQAAYQDFANPPAHCFVVGKGLEMLGERLSLDALCSKVQEALEEALA